MTPDVNILVAASRADHPNHAAAQRWLTGVLADCLDGQTLEILPIVATGFLRLVTHPKVFVQPTPISEATSFLRALLKMPGVEMAALGAEWPELLRLCESMQAKGNDIPDAWIAAAVQRGDSHLVTFDKGFHRLLTKDRLTVLVA